MLLRPVRGPVLLLRFGASAVLVLAARATGIRQVLAVAPGSGPVRAGRPGRVLVGRRSTALRGHDFFSQPQLAKRSSGA
jgi:hypothetical protein